MLRRLSRNKLVSRDRVAHDNRSVEITLTAKGQRIAEKCQRFADSHNGQLLDGVDPQDAAVLRRTLRRMYANAVRWGEREAAPRAATLDPDTAHVL
jgi:DNA-binding MarR family transcriptional regulator